MDIASPGLDIDIDLAALERVFAAPTVVRLRRYPEGDHEATLLSDFWK
jgi:hypothetical protein